VGIRRYCNVCGQTLPAEKPPVPVIDKHTGELHALSLCSMCAQRPERIRRWGWRPAVSPKDAA
jgi:hypothetical protein